MLTYLETILLHCLQQVNGERSVYSIYHILKGKKSSQTIQDSHLFKLSSYFYSLPNLHRTFYDEKIGELVEKGYIFIADNDSGKLTEAGEEVLNSCKEEKFFPTHMDGIKFGDNSIVFWKRTSLLIQVLSNLNQGENHFFPIQREKEIQNWVKIYIKKTADRKLLSKKIFEELYSIFTDNNNNKKGPKIFVYKLTGYKNIGGTDEQIAVHDDADEIEYRFCFLDILHYILVKIQEHTEKFPVLYSISQDLLETYVLTDSTKKTLFYLKKGFTIDKISAVRGLKESTIEDHIVEITFTIKDFPIEQFITLHEMENVTERLKQLKTKKLKPIKEAFPHLSYFQIRMVLAKNGEKL
ncbi:helix-turn-helix domain-containing protein [Bacillus seohaeanensis]|jgi:uncharacterized protein YpbB|uniref:Helix-turn-helix domain-containing protein n=1 Tax=Bacillus seohaeanensis TaxID=284580 RepID=A0ABW5RME3_9BACI